MIDPFDDLMKLWDKTSDEHIAWQKTRHAHSRDEMFETLTKLLAKQEEIEKYTEIIKPLSPMDKAPSLAAKYKNLYQIQSFLSDVLLELFSQVMSQMKKEKMPVKDFLDPRIQFMIKEQVRIEVAKKLQKPKVKHDTKRKKKSLYHIQSNNFNCGVELNYFQKAQDWIHVIYTSSHLPTCYNVKKCI